MAYKVIDKVNVFLYKNSILDLAGMDLTFFKGFPMLCFQLMTKTHQCFGYCCTVHAQHQGFLFFPLCPSSEQAGGGKYVGREHR